MTIAACYLSAEGVVFGADSTTTMYVPNPGGASGGTEHHFNYAQKIFQVGDRSTLGITMWGLGNLGQLSYRTLIAQFSDAIAQTGPMAMAQLSQRWSEFFFQSYTGAPHIKAVQERVCTLQDQARLSADEASELEFLKHSFSGGFCLGGLSPQDRTPSAFEIAYSPAQTTASTPRALSLGTSQFWGCPNLIDRLVYGVDFGILEHISQSSKWTGNNDDLIALVRLFALSQPFDLPIREAIDWIYSSIYTTIQAMKFSHLAPVCGGPVEIAMITTDRPFRWVKHKRLDAAIGERGTSYAE